MITNIFLNYWHTNPIGYQNLRYDDIKLYADDWRNKDYVNKAMSFLFKSDKSGLMPCECVRFDYEDGHSILCEVKEFGNLPKWENKSIVTVTNLDGGCRESTYNIDRNTLKKQLLKELPKE